MKIFPVLRNFSTATSNLAFKSIIATEARQRIESEVSDESKTKLDTLANVISSLKNI